MTEGRCCLHKFRLPKNILLVGCSQSGKTEFIKRLLLEREEVFDPQPTRVIYCYTAWQNGYDQLQVALGDAVDFRTDIPTKEELAEMWDESRVETLLVLDDKMTFLVRPL